MSVSSRSAVLGVDVHLELVDQYRDGKQLIVLILAFHDFSVCSVIRPAWLGDERLPRIADKVRWMFVRLRGRDRLVVYLGKLARASGNRQSSTGGVGKIVPVVVVARVVELV